jgi:hypothetical protein
MTANADDGEYSLLNLVPTVLRARGFRLYTQGAFTKTGKQRLVDLWLNGGAAILGHTPPNVLREIKNTASRGLYAPFPHFLQARYIKALSKLLPGRSFRLYAAPPEELESLFKNGTAGLWRPFANPESPFAVANNKPVLIPVLPGIHSWRGGLPLGLCVLAAQSESELALLPPGDFLSPVLLAAATRGVYDLLACPDRAKPAFPRIFKILQNSKWQRQGIYLNLKEKMETAGYEPLFRQFLDAGFLIPPVPSLPLILPGELSAGEEAKLTLALS